MRKISLVLLSFAVLAFTGCETSEGLKYGVLQKVSHKTFPCNYYAAEFAFQGGRMVGSSDSKAYENTQSVQITEQQYTELQSMVGKEVVFDYKDRGIAVCGEGKLLTTIRLK